MKNAARRQNEPDRRTLSLLILSCSGGAGHLRAAEALHRTAASGDLPIRTEHHDVLDLTSPAFKRLYAGSYLSMVNSAPELWGYLYQRAERSPYRKDLAIRLFDRLMYRRYVQEIRARRPDALVCTHFLPFISISSVLRKMQMPVYAVTTDFDIHQLWVDPAVTRYSVFHDESKWQLRAKGIPEERIAVHGIPVMPEFAAHPARAAARRRLRLPSSALTVLVLSGGFGVGRIDTIVEEIVRTLASAPDRRATVLAVCGRNDEARARVASLPVPAHVTLRAFGFVENVPDLMAASDLLVSKSGGLTSSEALASALPMLIIDPIPGQESRNADLLVEHGAAWKAVNLANLSYKLTMLMRDRTLLSRARDAARTLARPTAARTILEDIVSHVSRRGDAS